MFDNLEDRWDHPRVCGEHGNPNVIYVGETGSSPRMRGARFAETSGTHDKRIIPAYAGSTLKDPCNPNNMIDKISDF